MCGTEKRAGWLAMLGTVLRYCMTVQGMAADELQPRMVSYLPTRVLCGARYCHARICLRACYAMPGTDLAPWPDDWWRRHFSDPSCHHHAKSHRPSDPSRESQRAAPEAAL
eukprot:460915-Rhodomonas_salina.1